MSFWSTSDGEDLTKTAEKEFDGGGGSYDIVPDKTNCLMNLDRAAWKEDKDKNRYINVQWSVLKPEAFEKTVVFQKLWVKDDDPRAKDPAKKRDKALKMLSAIDANAGGKLAKAGREPDDDDLALALTNKQMICKVMVWEMDGEDGKPMEGNWIAAVGSKGGSMAISEGVKPAAKKADTGGGGSSARRPAADPFDDDIDDDIPFITMNADW